MYSDNGKISIRQMQILLILNTFGVIITIMPGLNSVLPDNGGVYAPIAGGIAAFLSIFLITGVSGFLGEQGFFGGIARLMGKPAACIISILFVIKLIFSVSADIRIFSGAAKEWLLPGTPTWLISAVILLPCIYCAVKGCEARAHLGEILIFIILIPFGLAYGTALFRLIASGSLPHISLAKGIYINSSLSNCFCFTGIELLLPAFAYLKNPYEARIPALSAFLITLLAAAAVNAVTISVLGSSLTETISYPAISALAAETGTESMAALTLSILYLSVVIFSSGCIFFSTEILKSIIKRSSYLFIAGVAAAGFCISIIPLDLKDFGVLNNRFNLIFGTFFFFVLPLLLNIIFRIKKEED